jgi:uncharacterized protein (UPF0335 family)
MTLETITISHGGESVTFKGVDEMKAVTASLKPMNQEHPLKRKVDSILNLTREIRSLREDITTLYNDAKEEGLNVPALRLLVKIKDAETDSKKYNKMREVSEVLEVYAKELNQPLLPGMTI